MRTLVTALLLLFGTILHAEENNLGITSFGSFIHTDHVPNALFFFSQVEKSDSFELRRALRTYDIDTIVLASDGGSVWEALTIAGVIFDKKMTAYIPKMPDEKGCYSACAFMFFAGQTRLAEGFLAVHQVGAYDEVADAQKEKLGVTQQETQFTTSEIIGFLNEFGTPPWVYERMFRSRELYFFSDEEKATLNYGVIDDAKKSKIDSFLILLRSELEKLPKDAEPISTSIELNPVNQRIVKNIQILLNEARCAAGATDGVWGSQTDAAASKFASANDLKYSGPTSVDKPFMDLLLSKQYKPCPAQPKPAIHSRISKQWSFNLVCNGRSLEGNSTFEYRNTNKGKQTYSMLYVNSIGGKYTGSAIIHGNYFNFSLATVPDGNVVTGSGRFNGSEKRGLTGKSSDGCQFIGKAI
jgi:peptidoglycan hydrolase-like protein with peptidoglycan-binding domain